MPSLVQRAMSFPPLRSVARGASNWVDLQWSFMIDQLKEVAPLARGALLDVGCGEKPYEWIFAPYVTSYLGIEHEGTFGETHASVAAQAGKPDLYYDGAKLPFADESFDTVLNVQVLEHTPEPQRLLHEIARVLRPGGTLILCAPFSFRLHEEPHDYFRYTPHGLRAMCGASGLRVDEVRSQGGLWSVLGHKLNSYLAFRVAVLDAVAQAMGKLGHEGERRRSPRYWTMPVVLPAMGAISASARLLDRFAPDGTETLSYLVIARKMVASASAA